jgi:hypothetical protein
MSAGSIITVAKYNELQSLIASVIGKGNGEYGYGLPITSSPVATNSIVVIRDMELLRDDITRAYQLQLLVNPNLPLPRVNISVNTIQTESFQSLTRYVVTTVGDHNLLENQVIGPFKNVQGNITGINSGSSTGVDQTNKKQFYVNIVSPTKVALYIKQSNIDPITDEVTFIDIKTNIGITGTGSGGTFEANLIRFDFYEIYLQRILEIINNINVINPACLTLQTNKLVSERPNSWSGAGQSISIFHEFKLMFDNIDHRRHFFNTGGEIRFSAELQNPNGPKWNPWRDLFQDMGSIKFAKDGTTSTGSGVETNIGNFQLTEEYQTVFTKNSVGVYADNYYKIQAKGSQSSNIITFKVEFADVYAPSLAVFVAGKLISRVSQLIFTCDVGVKSPMYQTIRDLTFTDGVYGVYGGSPTIIGPTCDPTQGVTGVGRGIYTYTLNLGNYVGTCGIDYNAYTEVPDIFTITWNNQTYTTGSVLGRGKLTFVKTSSTPSTATLIVNADRKGTKFDWKIICPPLIP